MAINVKIIFQSFSTQEALLNQYATVSKRNLELKEKLATFQ